MSPPAAADAGGSPALTDQRVIEPLSDGANHSKFEVLVAKAEKTGEEADYGGQEESERPTHEPGSGACAGCNAGGIPAVPAQTAIDELPPVSKEANVLEREYAGGRHTMEANTPAYNYTHHNRSTHAQHQPTTAHDHRAWRPS